MHGRCITPSSRFASSLVPTITVRNASDAALAQMPEPRVPEPASGQAEQQRERPGGADPGPRQIGLQPERQEHHDRDRGRDRQDDPAELLGRGEPVGLVQMRPGEDGPDDERGTGQEQTEVPRGHAHPEADPVGAQQCELDREGVAERDPSIQAAIGSARRGCRHRHLWRRVDVARSSSLRGCAIPGPILSIRTVRPATTLP